MATLGGLQIETPQEILARMANARQRALLAAESPEQVNQINMGRALDLIMGNPEVEAARRKTAAVTNAVRSAQDLGKEQGLNPQQTRRQELVNIRDALLETDPEQALQVTQMIQQQEIANLERRKLQQQITAGDMDLAAANKRYVLNPDTLESEELDVSTVEGAQRLLAARQRGEATADSEGALLNLYNAERARQHDTEMEAAMMRAKREQQALTKVDTSLLGKETANTLKKGLPALRQPLDQLERAASLLNDPRYQSVAGKIKNFKAKASDLFSSGILSKEEAEWYSQVTRVRANIANAVGEFRHERFGGALTEPEIKKGKEYLPDAEDTPLEYLDKTEELYRMFQVGTRRASAALSADRWDVLTQPGTDFWNEETDRLFDPKMRGDRFPSAPKPEPTFGSRRARRQTQPSPKTGVTATDILNRYRGQ
jgi:hypothetical protein